MNKKELIKEIATVTGLTQVDVTKVLDGFKSVVVDTLKSGEEILLAGFMTFKPSVTKIREGRNPKTGEAITIPAKKVVKVKLSKRIEL